MTKLSKEIETTLQSYVGKRVVIETPSEADLTGKAGYIRRIICNPHIMVEIEPYMITLPPWNLRLVAVTGDEPA